ncbi:hypothetical protein NBRGN_091_00850 [Nocardia brasiliensis NBRC 14402]|uniref:hypothetical protein n=1 Tax=Nocardia brasiliensis TaxID=37326 RepID=UPI0002EFB943|nr:hypothetical protein [Nocardia brasiliensis]ASF06786.1 hypothetical protein CEQ30_04950 [Nocardia brasiliensis]GAJ85369.1 hypothetical protein NBRGN_091_00850 [Nocardia brasiliensis NBRC 14402]SUB48013.1 Uncharacterised protein [Nocardia brasiliensis]
MFRTAGFVGAVALAGAVGFLAPGTAQAATGTVTINNTAHDNPVGCIKAEDNFYTTLQISVGNATDRAIKAYASGDCSGASFGEVPPATIGYLPKGGSVFVE